MRKKNKQRQEQSNQKDKEEKKLTDIIAKVKSSDDNIKPYTERFLRYYKLYRNHIPADQWPTKSRIFNPLTFSIIETQTAKMMSTKPIGTWKPSNTNGQKPKGNPEKIQMAFDDWWRREKATLKSQDVFKKTSMYGGCASQLYWKYQTGFKLGQKFVKVSRPSIRILRAEDAMFGFDPEPDNFDDCRWGFVRYPISKKELEDIKNSPLSKNYKNLDEAIKSFEGGAGSEAFPEEGYMKDRKEVTGAKSVSDETIKKAECIYLENYETGELTIVVGRKHIIQDCHNPHLIDRSLIFTMITRIPSETIGMSDVEPIESLQHGANLFRNQRADNIDRILKSRFINADDEADDEELADDDVIVVHAKDPQKIKSLSPENVTATAYKEDETIKNDVYAATSITPFSMGSDADVQSDRSGVAINRLQGAADARVKNKLMNFELTFIKEVAEKWQRLMAQYQTESIFIDDNGKEVEITPEDLGNSKDGEYGEWDFHMETGSTQHVNEIESRDDYVKWQDKIIELAEKKKAEAMPQQPQVDPATGQPQIDPMTGQPVMPQQPPKILDYDKMAEKLSEKFGQKDWRQVWIIEEKPKMMEPVEEDMLPGLEAEQGEMLPAVDGMQMPDERQEMLSGVEPVQQQDPAQAEMLPNVEPAQQQQGEMLPAVVQAQLPAEPQQEMLPPVQQKQGLISKLKGLFKRGKGKEMLPPA